MKQAQSKQKIIDKMVERGLTEKPIPDPKYSFRFPQTGRLAPPIVSFKDVSFSYVVFEREAREFQSFHFFMFQSRD